MKRLCSTLTMFVLAAFFAFSTFAADAPDAWVKGLWLKATGLPKASELEDMTQEKDEPHFIYSFAQGADGPAVTIALGRVPQNKLAENIAQLDKKALAEFAMSESAAKSVKDLKFTKAPKFSKKYTYPCQMATYTDSEMGLSNTILFIQTDNFMFYAQVNRVTKDKQYSEADAAKWLMQLNMVEQ